MWRDTLICPRATGSSGSLLVWSLTLYHTHSSTVAGIIVYLSPQNNLRVRGLLTHLSGEWLWVGVLGAASGWSGFVAGGIWPCLVISLHLCFISPSSLSLSLFRSLFHRDTLTEHNYLSLSVCRLRMKSTRLPQFISSLAHICILFDKYALILVFISWCHIAYLLATIWSFRSENWWNPFRLHLGFFVF